MNFRRWNDAVDEMTLSTVRRLYQEAHCRVSEYKFPPGTAFAGARTRKCTWYVLRGACVLTTNGEHVLSAGDVVDLDACEYALRVTGTEDLKLIIAWKLLDL